MLTVKWLFSSPSVFNKMSNIPEPQLRTPVFSAWPQLEIDIAGDVSPQTLVCVDESTGRQNSDHHHNHPSDHRENLESQLLQ
jgi:hypothetical protein